MHFKPSLMPAWVLSFTAGLAFAQCETPGPADGTAAQIVALTGQGQARARSDADWAAAALAQQLPHGAELRTLALSSAGVLLADATQIRMAANALLRVCDARAQQVRLELPLGRVWARTKGRAPANLQLQTPAAVAAVRGTDWDVEVDAQGRTTLTVLSGQIDVSNDYGAVQLGPSEQASVVPGQAPVKRTLVAPRERVQWVMASQLLPTRWPELAQGAAPWHAPALQALQSGELLHLQQLVQARLQQTPDDALAQRLLAETEVQAGALEAAQQRLLALWNQQQDGAAAARRAQLLLALEREEEAAQFLSAARQRQPASSALLLAQADAQRLQGAAGPALALYQQAVQQAQDEGQRAAALAGLGRAQRERGDLAASRSTLAQALALQPQDAEYLAEAAISDSQALHLPAAGRSLQQALAATGDDYVALAADGLLALQRGDAEQARQQLLKALVIEPRYAQAQIWLAVAEYQSGNAAGAFDSLERARQADPRDPMPWQIESILRNDSGQPQAAIAAAREALQRLPYLKSLNPLASDSQGSANLGKALGDFGLEHWARAYAQQSYYPLWAGSHFFMANRLESDYARNSELMQGYLADPLAFGMREREVPVLLTQGQEAVLAASAQRDSQHTSLVGDASWRGLNASTVPTAWLLRANHIDMAPRGGTGGYWLHGPSVDMALGMKPSERLSLFAVLNHNSDRYAYPGGLDLGAARMDGVVRNRSNRLDVGGSWRWSADAQTWFKWHRASLLNRQGLDFEAFGPQDSRLDTRMSGWMLRHVLQAGNWQLNFGWEKVRAREVSGIYDPGQPFEASEWRNTPQMQMPWLDAQWASGPWAVQAGLYRPHLKVRYTDRYYSQLDGQDLLEPIHISGGHATRWRPRLGASYQFAPGVALRAAYIESMYAPATHSLAPLTVAGIAIDHQYQRIGSLARKAAVQMDWEVNPRNFLWAMASRQTIHNPTFDDGRMLIPSMAIEAGDRAQLLAPMTATGTIGIDAYNGNPLFSQGRLRQLGAAWNHIVSPRWSASASYTHAWSRNTGVNYAGSWLPGVPKHTAVLSSVLRHQGRDFSAVSMVYRGSRFADVANEQPLGAGWSMGLVLYRELAQRRWAWTATVQTPLHGTVRPTLWMGLRYRLD